MWQPSTPTVPARTPGRTGRSPQRRSPTAGGREPGSSPATIGKGDLRCSSRPTAVTRKANGGTLASANKRFLRENGEATLLGNGFRLVLPPLRNPASLVSNRLS